MIKENEHRFKTLILAWGKPTSTTTRGNRDEATSNTPSSKIMKTLSEICVKPVWDNHPVSTSKFTSSTSPRRTRLEPNGRPNPLGKKTPLWLD